MISSNVTQTFDSEIRDLSNLDRVSLIQKLIRMEVGYQHQYRISRRAELGSVDRYSGDEARANSERLRRIIYFLRFRTLAEDALPEDVQLCSELAERFQAKGQWTESYPVGGETDTSGALW